MPTEPFDWLNLETCKAADDCTAHHTVRICSRDSASVSGTEAGECGLSMLYMVRLLNLLELPAWQIRT